MLTTEKCPDQSALPEARIRVVFAWLGNLTTCVLDEVLTLTLKLRHMSSMESKITANLSNVYLQYFQEDLIRMFS